NLLTYEKYLLVILKYTEGFEINYIMNIISKTKLNEQHMKTFIENSKKRKKINELLSILIDYFLIPTKEQIAYLISNKNKIDDNILKRLNLNYDEPLVIIAYISNGIYPIPNNNIKKIIKLSTDEKN